MNFTFGIVTGGNQESNISKIIDSIERQNISNYEIIVVGGSKLDLDRKNLKYHSFNEYIKPGWITKKKNMIAYHAQYENIVMMHDYIVLDGNEDQWFRGYLKFQSEVGNDWKVCNNKQFDNIGERNIDLSLLHEDLESFVGKDNKNQCLLPYPEKAVLNHPLSKFCYVNGSYFVVNKQFMEQNPLNEDLLWGMAEDLEWSKRIRNKHGFSFNPYSSVSFTKRKGNPLVVCSKHVLDKVYSLV